MLYTIKHKSPSGFSVLMENGGYGTIEYTDSSTKVFLYDKAFPNHHMGNCIIHEFSRTDVETHKLINIVLEFNAGGCREFTHAAVNHFPLHKQR